MNPLIENTYFSFINLTHRLDRLLHMKKELEKAGIDAERTSGILPKEVKGDLSRYKVMLERTPGALGCHLAQTKVMEKALSLNKHAGVFEDDLVFCDDFQKRMDYINEFTKTHSWDVLWLGGTFHVNPPHWHTGKNPDLLGTTMRRDAELTDDPRMVRTYGCFCTYAYIVNVNSIQKILKLLDQYVHESMGIDWLFIKLQPQLNTFSFVPGCIKQMDNPSDIGRPDKNGKKAFTYFSHFAKSTGPYWWARKLEDFDPLKFDWKEVKNK